MTSLRRPDSGTLISTPRDGSRPIERGTLTCVWCGYTWLPEPGSGRRRGYTTNPRPGWVCGRPCCVALGPRSPEQWLDNIEAGMVGLAADLFKPILVSVPAAPPGE